MRASLATASESIDSCCRVMTSTLPGFSSSGCASSVVAASAAFSTCCFENRRPILRRRSRFSAPLWLRIFPSSCRASPPRPPSRPSLRSRIVVGLPPEPAMAPTSRAANLPLALSSAASRRRSRLVTKPLASSASRSSRSRSSLAQRQALERPAQHRRHRHRRDHRHGDDQREQILIEHARRQADRCDDHLGRAARIHAAAERERFRAAQPAELAADKGAERIFRCWRSG